LFDSNRIKAIEAGGMIGRSQFSGYSAQVIEKMAELTANLGSSLRQTTNENAALAENKGDVKIDAEHGRKMENLHPN
jgi:hypothetical protein